MRYFRFATMALALCVALSAVKAAEKLDPKPFDAMVDKAMKGYNDGDYKAFFADYAKMMAGIATEQTFKLMYADKFKKEFGDYVSRTLIEKETVLMNATPLMVFEAEFTKEKKVKLSVNFIKEGDNFKIMQITLNKM